MEARVIELVVEEEAPIAVLKALLNRRERLTNPELALVMECAPLCSAEQLQGLKVRFKENLDLLFPMLMRGTPTLNHTQLFRRAILDDIIPLSRSPIFFSPEMVFRAKLKGLSWANEKIPFHSIDGVRKGAFGHLYDIIWAVTDMLRFRIRLWRKKV